MSPAKGARATELVGLETLPMPAANPSIFPARSPLSILHPQQDLRKKKRDPAKKTNDWLPSCHLGGCWSRSWNKEHQPRSNVAFSSPHALHATHDSMHSCRRNA